MCQGNKVMAYNHVRVCVPLATCPSTLCYEFFIAQGDLNFSIVFIPDGCVSESHSLTLTLSFFFSHTHSYFLQEEEVVVAPESVDSEEGTISGKIEVSVQVCLSVLTVV